MLSSKTKICQNCKNKFTIQPEDFEFYKKIDVPEPTFCPECRMQRRMAFRKESPIFYRRKCKATNKDLISFYHPKSPVKIYDQKYWWSDKWDPMEYGIDCDFNKTFFEQFYQLIKKVPFPAVFNDNVDKSDYCNACTNIKNCYLVTNSGYGENAAYSNRIVKVKDSLDVYITDNSELCYQDLYCSNSYKIFFSNHCDSCVESWFLYDCRNCEHCFGCTNLRHKKYHIFNKPHSKEEYFKKLKEFDLGSYRNLVEQKKNFLDIYNKSIHKFANINKSVNISGDEIANSKNCYHCFDIKGCEDLKYVNWAGFGFPLKDAYDCGPGAFLAELFYESIDAGAESSRNLFANVSYYSSNIEYSFNLHSCSNLFGCIGLRHKKYCILNKQYTKEEYKKLVPKIKEHMNQMPYKDKKGRIYKYGEFFPIEFSPFSYEESIAQEHFALSKNQTTEEGYPWFDKLKSEYQPTIKAKNLPDHINDINKDILDDIIECDNKGKNCAGSSVFRLIAQELKFYQKQNIPLPRLCPSCRHRERIKQRNPLKLWKRKCMKEGCPNTFQTIYAPDRKEIVYCESCYNKEVS